MVGSMGEKLKGMVAEQELKGPSQSLVPESSLFPVPTQSGDAPTSLGANSEKLPIPVQ